MIEDPTDQVPERIACPVLDAMGAFSSLTSWALAGEENGQKQFSN
jgi:hypothetical protein